MVISFKDLKTVDTQGPACVVLSLSLFSYLRLYVSEMRSQVEDSTSEEYGMSWNGFKLESGQISTAINCKRGSKEACIQAASSLPTIMRSAEPKKGVATTSHDVSLAADDRKNKERMLWDEEQVATLRCIFHRN